MSLKTAMVLSAANEALDAFGLDEYEATTARAAIPAAAAPVSELFSSSLGDVSPRL